MKYRHGEDLALKFYASQRMTAPQMAYRGDLFRRGENSIRSRARTLGVKLATVATRHRFADAVPSHRMPIEVAVPAVPKIVKTKIVVAAPRADATRTNVTIPYGGRRFDEAGMLIGKREDYLDRLGRVGLKPGAVVPRWGHMVPT